MRVLSYLVLLLMFSVASGQTPTILQGDYISNVFGNSNFVLNPNAQTSNCTTSGTITCANVTVTNASITRVTTTPLVARSEFNVAITSANGTATWATRSFDAGMKGQNCEARFSYRGFAATSKVHIKQGANTVASLNLTPATDPRIASINFPCGDLSNPTTFVVTDTAILAGTNEIGGIYVGLATNMANVAQAEFVGRVTFGTDCFWSTSSSTYNSPSDATCTPTVVGNVASVAGVKPQLTITDTRPGNYYVVWSGGSLQRQQIATYSFCSVRLGDGSVSFGGYLDGPNMFQQQFLTAAGTFQYTTAGTRTIGIEMRNNDSINPCQINTSTDSVQMSVYRFPSASELVVTPERQNTWAGVVYTNQNQALFNTTPEPTAYAPFNNATWNQPTLLKGKAAVTTTNSGNDLGFSVANLPVGNYKFEISGLINASTGSVTTGASTICNFELVETTTSAKVARQNHQDQQFGATLGNETRNYVNAFSGVFNNTSVATRNFRLEAQKHFDTTPSNIGVCQAFSSTSAGNNVNIAIIMTPLDQPSNSALYVQGPVLGANTGAAIPEGYVNEFATRSISDTSLRSSSGVTLGTWYYPWTSELTLPAGNWNICYRVAARLAQNRAATNVAQLLTRLENKTDGTSVFENITWPTYDNSTTSIEGFLNTHFGCQPISITTSKIFRVGIRANTLLGTPTGVDISLRGDLVKSELYAIRLN